PNQAGYAPRGGAKPRVLDHVPGFFKPTKNEHLIEGRHAAMQPKLQQMREQRRQQVQQQRQGTAPGARSQTPGAKAAAEARRTAEKPKEPANAHAGSQREVQQQARAE